MLRNYRFRVFPNRKGFVILWHIVENIVLSMYLDRKGGIKVIGKRFPSPKHTFCTIHIQHRQQCENDGFHFITMFHRTHNFMCAH